jgi:hypothetical protein
VGLEGADGVLVDEVEAGAAGALGVLIVFLGGTEIGLVGILGTWHFPEMKTKPTSQTQSTPLMEMAFSGQTTA